ncbi:hypothetical protein LI328DRAFT_164264 [Trichoderma asperelloides]|nr:hypothetical protein LI328DRAFT_164264 [Trichoderma asperelloides]
MTGRKGQEQRSAGAGRQQFEFISVSGTNIRGNAETRRRVRSRAQADYRRRNPPPPRNALTVDLDVGSWLQALSREAATRPPHQALESAGMQPVLQSTEMMQINTNEFGPISADNSASIFELVPADQRPRARQLWNHLYGGCVVFKSMIEIGFFNLLQGSASLTQMLSSSAWHMKSSSTEDDDESSIDYARYSLMATRALRRRLDDPVQQASLETITAILAFAAFANLTSNPQLINVHLDGLSHAISSVGGLAVLRHLPVIQIMMIDVRGSYLQDRKPRYPQPYEILSTESKIRVAPMPAVEQLGSNGLLSQDPAVKHIFEAIQQVNSLINAEAYTLGDVFWQSVLFPGFQLAPILYDLLSLPRVTHGMASKFSIRRECFRLAGILYVSEVRAKFGMDNTGATSFAQKLLRSLKSPEMLSSWESDNFFLIWSLTIGSVSLCVPEALRLEFMDMLSERLTHSLPDVLPIASRLFI